MLHAKSQLSRLVKATLAGEEVIIATHDSPQLKLLPFAASAGLEQPDGLPTLVLQASQVDAAFGEDVDQQVANLFNSCGTLAGYLYVVLAASWRSEAGLRRKRHPADNCFHLVGCEHLGDGHKVFYSQVGGIVGRLSRQEC
jgi:antitoxin (DNA-binding transcriptional repressor) of toxin-antitoxin stability system